MQAALLTLTKYQKIEFVKQKHEFFFIMVKK